MKKICKALISYNIIFLSVLFLFGCQRDMIKKLEITYPSGQVWQTGYMEYDEFGYKRECGEWTFFYKNGQKLSTGEYRHGQKHGHWVYWRPDGEMMYEVTYNNGVPVIISESS